MTKARYDKEGNIIFEPTTELSDLDVVSVKLNTKERNYLEAIKRYYRTPYDSTALKIASFEVFLKIEELDKILNK